MQTLKAGTFVWIGEQKYELLADVDVQAIDIEVDPETPITP